nr:TonB-dependent receptor [Aurantimonas aggregata]
MSKRRVSGSRAHSPLDRCWHESNSVSHQHQASIWSDYTVQGGQAKGLGVGAGLRYVGESWGDDTNSFKNDSRILVDASLSYDFGAANPKLEGVSAQVNAKNLFDKRDATCSSGYCYREEGRNVIGSLRYRF